MRPVRDLIVAEDCSTPLEDISTLPSRAFIFILALEASITEPVEIRNPGDEPFTPTLGDGVEAVKS